MWLIQLARIFHSNSNITHWSHGHNNCSVSYLAYHNPIHSYSKIIKMKIKLTECCSRCALSMFTVALKGTTLHIFVYDGAYHYLFIESVQWWKWFFNFITIFNNGLLINHGHFLTIPSQPMWVFFAIPKMRWTEKKDMRFYNDIKL